ncbi:hypothetical protein HSX11_12135 [Oxalobacteraceae bacterium]|nr:hypothetical protein [Oxalobacteraceae bacterium]
MTSDYPELIADVPEPYSELLPGLPLHATAPQSWNITVADAKFHWYDLIAGFPIIPDIRDPVGRYMRRMQFDLEAAMEKRLIYLVINRPRVRFDTTRAPSWGFFSLKVIVPILVGNDEKRGSVTIELEVPFAATMKKPTVAVTDKFITFNWGGLVEAMSIHDVMQKFDNDVDFASRVQYVGQTRDPAGRLAKARLASVQKVHQQNSEDYDMLLLIQRMNVEVISDEGDPLSNPANQNPVAVDALQKDRMDAVDCALARFFEGEVTRHRTDKERATRRERMREVERTNQLERFRIDLRLEGAGKYHNLISDVQPASTAHLLDCQVALGEVIVTRVREKGRE